VPAQHKPPFPWTFLSDPDGPDAELAAVWIFRHLQGKAYRGFLEAGPGVLVGPFFSDEEDVPITCREAIRRRARDQMVGIAVMYLPALSQEFAEMIPVAPVRETIYLALDRYDPESQCVILLRHDDTALSVSIIGFEEGPSGPRTAHYRELLEQSVPGGLPN
jgi:hypothetical protein